MKGDFTRDTFDLRKHFSRVLLQQGRVLLDADWNEQAAILLHYLRALAADLIGPHGGPGDSFKITTQASAIPLLSIPSPIPLLPWKGRETLEPGDFYIAGGHYYAAGLLCENEARAITYTTQPYRPGLSPLKAKAGSHYLIYLDAWERHVTWVEEPTLREVALGGPDTATRAQVVWQVQALALTATEANDIAAASYNGFLDLLAKKNLYQAGNSQLKAKGKENPQAETEPCLAPPDARYRGQENQLYRVEIHQGGDAKTATFKWSRDNGSVVYPLVSLQGAVATLEHLGRDDRFRLAEGDWVELVDQWTDLQGEPGLLVQVQKIDPAALTVTLSRPADATPDLPDYDAARASASHPLLRRWDHRAGDPRLGGLTLRQGAATVQEGRWLTLENGVQIWFNPGGTYCLGDSWLIPARTATGDVEWPGAEGAPELVPCRRVEHAYAPLALVTVGANGNLNVTRGLRRIIPELELEPPPSVRPPVIEPPAEVRPPVK